MTDPIDWTPQPVTDPCPDCGKQRGTVACNARHVAVNTANLRRDRET